jgi:hypothetical protein
MATTQNTYTGNGSTTNYSFTFEYLKQSDVKVTLDTVATTAFTFANATTLSFTSAPANNVAIRIFRDTAIDTLSSTFFPGSTIKAEDLNQNFTQNLYVTQESETAVDISNTTANDAKTTVEGAITTANSAVTTANSAVTTANSAVTTANSAVNTANAASVAVSNAVLFTLVATVAAIPGSPFNNDFIEIGNSTGIESFSPLSGLPSGFVGASGLTVRLRYDSSASTWVFMSYFANDSEDRYLTKNIPLGSATAPSLAFTGDTNTGIYSPGADQVAITTGGTERLRIASTGAMGLSGANYGTAGQVLVSNGSSASPTWEEVGPPNTTYTYPGGVEQTVQQRLEQYVSVKDFGAVGDGVTDDTAAIQAAVNATQGTGKTLYIPSADYLVTRQGVLFTANTNTTHYAVRITDTLTIINEGTIKFAGHDGATSTCAFGFTGVLKAKFIGGNFVATDATSGALNQQFDGYAVMMYQCESSRVENISTLNTGGGSYLFQCNGSTIDSCYAEKEVTTPVQFKCGAFYSIFGGKRNTIRDCVTYGGTDDGDIGCYGVGDYNSLINNRIYAFERTDTTETPTGLARQGYFIDAGQQNALVNGNFCQGYYYAIDVKTAIANCLVTNNVSYKNKVGISVRQGEASDINMSCTISDNLIIPAKGNGFTASLLGYSVIGIMVQDAPQTTISNNRFSVDWVNNNVSSPEEWAGIVVREQTVFNTFQLGCISIQDNTFDYAQTIGGNTSINKGIYIDIDTNNSLENFRIVGNSFACANDQDKSRIIVEGGQSLTFNDNQINGDNDFVIGSDPQPFLSTQDTKWISVCGNTWQEPNICVQATMNTGGTGRSSIRQVMFSNNILGAGSSGGFGQSVVTVDGDCGVTINGNSRYFGDLSNTNSDNRILKWTNAPTDPYLTMMGNTFRSTPSTPNNYYLINGAGAATGAHILINDNI